MEEVTYKPPNTCPLPMSPDGQADCGNKTEAFPMSQNGRAQGTSEGGCMSISQRPLEAKGQRWHVGSYLLTSQEDHVGEQGFPESVSEEWGKAKLCAEKHTSSSARGGFTHRS